MWITSNLVELVDNKSWCWVELSCVSADEPQMRVVLCWWWSDDSETFVGICIYLYKLQISFPVLIKEKRRDDKFHFGKCAAPKRLFSSAKLRNGIRVLAAGLAIWILHSSLWARLSSLLTRMIYLLRLLLLLFFFLSFFSFLLHIRMKIRSLKQETR